MLFEDLLKAANRELPAWLERWQPDAVICADNRMLGVLEWLGYRIPQDIGVAHLNLADDVKGWSGVHERHELIGVAAVDMVVSQMEHSEYGPTTNPRSILIDGCWVNGSTTRRLSPRATQ